MTNIIDRLTEYNKDWRTRAGSATEVNDAIAEIKRLRDAITAWRIARYQHAHPRDIEGRCKMQAALDLAENTLYEMADPIGLLKAASAACCSAILPCSHQQRDPFSVCDECKMAQVTK